MNRRAFGNQSNLPILSLGIGLLAGLAALALQGAICLELTHDSTALLPLLTCSTVSNLVSLGMLRHSIVTEKIARRRTAADHEHESDSLTMHTVGQFMTTEVETVPLSLPLWRLLDRMYGCKGRSKPQGYPVVDDEGRLAGMVTRSDLPDFSMRDDLGWLIVADVMSSQRVLVAWPEETLRDAAARMVQAGVGRLPVVSPSAPNRIMGLVSRTDILKGLSQQAEKENRRERFLGAA